MVAVALKFVGSRPAMAPVLVGREAKDKYAVMREFVEEKEAMMHEFVTGEMVRESATGAMMDRKKVDLKKWVRRARHLRQQTCAALPHKTREGMSAPPQAERGGGQRQKRPIQRQKRPIPTAKEIPSIRTRSKSRRTTSMTSHISSARTCRETYWRKRLIQRQKRPIQTCRASDWQKGPVQIANEIPRTCHVTYLRI